MRDHLKPHRLPLGTAFFFLKERNAKAPTLLQLPKPPITHSKGALPHDCPPPEAPGGAGRKWTSWRAAGPGLDGGPPHLPHLPGAASPPPAPRTRCCPGSKSAAGRPGHCAGKEEGREGTRRGFLQGPKGLVMHGRLRATGPEEFSSPGPQGGQARGRSWQTVGATGRQAGSDRQLKVSFAQHQTHSPQGAWGRSMQPLGSSLADPDWAPGRQGTGVLGQNDGLPRALQGPDGAGEPQRAWGTRPENAHVA